MKILKKPTKEVFSYFDEFEYFDGEYIDSDGLPICKVLNELESKVIISTSYGFFEYSKFIYYKNFKVWPTNIFHLDGDNENLDISNLVTNLYSFSSVDDLKTRMSETIIFDDGIFYSKFTDDKIPFIFVGNYKVSIEHFFIFILSEDDEIIYFPSLYDFSFINNDVLSYKNIIKNDFLERIRFDFDTLFKYVYYDKSESVLKWKYSRKFNGLKNNILEDMRVCIDFIEYRVAYFNGYYYFYDDLEESYFLHHDMGL